MFSCTAHEKTILSSMVPHNAITNVFIIIIIIIIINLHHIWDRVLLNTPDLKISNDSGHMHRTSFSGHAQPIPTNRHVHRTIGHIGHAQTSKHLHRTS